MSERVKEVVDAIISSIRATMIEKQVTVKEYRAGILYLHELGLKGEIPLLSDVYFNSTAVENENRIYKGTRSDLEGPYYLADSPFITDEIKTLDDVEGEAMIIRGAITSVDGEPIANAELDIWHSTPDGRYSGIHDGVPQDCYRGRVITNDEGRYSVKSTTPIPYEIPSQGMTGQLLQMLGNHTWRPAHIHIKTKKKGFHELTTQAYFEGGDWTENDCCSGVCNSGVNIIAEKHEDGVRIMDIDLVLDKEVI
ncbi:Chlorocatechol 1,2-dioxygenase [Vibrio crassostreae]|uniref:dioxygenase family protein n=1 Tax=Vibrio TaxID=662 RepID=UPI0005E3773F|nr:dioxygenase [Vibrio crassostreae]CAH7065289.1 Chlorocatechol 1,2-dioxygenase [Vibrio chagasii]TCT59364.1 chlorocatechol 1,2-dioxygenase [Vibrio crassostreae]TCT80401.1 chlorocatechol 1,2-dioxygenase [Vibrio crassostreae]TCT95988.1 chlorocatechol 1,2-dioxygenase [Vibrio crassostreae]TDW07108.1 chlorocatechol 1,2-dioxygenase [Vibrio crassostreae]